MSEYAPKEADGTIIFNPVCTTINIFAALAERCHSLAKKKGFWPEEGRNDAECIALMHSELSEALEGLRDGNPTSEKLGHQFTQVEEELADLLIRVFDYAGARGLDLGDALLAKLTYNEGRLHKHGKEF